MIRLFNTKSGMVADVDGQLSMLEGWTFDALVDHDDLPKRITQIVRKDGRSMAGKIADADILAPIGSQEVWGAGATYLRNPKPADPNYVETIYDRAYAAERPYLFFKAAAHRVAGPGQEVRNRSDSESNGAEPELTLLLSPNGKLIGYTLGNDMGSRDMEKQNPLYLTQAKVTDGCCAMGPCVVLSAEAPPPTTEIVMEIRRRSNAMFAGATFLSRMKRSVDELVEFLFRDNSFPTGCYLMTGNGVPLPADFSLQSGDEISMTMEPVGTLRNVVAS